MASELTNFLPPERIRALRNDYRFRLLALVLGMLGFLVVVHGILLIPSYMYLSEKADAESLRLSELSAADAGNVPGSAISAKSVNADATRLLAVASSTPASDIVRALLLVPRPGIELQGISYDAGSRVIITGMATTRDALRAYDVALSALPYVSNADLPLSAYAKDSDISFSITLTGTLTP
jgi:hypothetical protein